MLYFVEFDATTSEVPTGSRHVLRSMTLPPHVFAPVSVVGCLFSALSGLHAVWLCGGGAQKPNSGHSMELRRGRKGPKL